MSMRLFDRSTDFTQIIGYLLLFGDHSFNSTLRIFFFTVKSGLSGTEANNLRSLLPFL